jgi:hypothetical protein
MYDAQMKAFKEPDVLQNMWLCVRMSCSLVRTQSFNEWQSNVPNLYRHRGFGLVGGENIGNVMYTLDFRPV